MAEDPIDVLRDCLLARRQIKEANGKIHLGSKPYLKSTLTNFPIKQSRGAKKLAKGRNVYNLGEIYYFIENRSLPHLEYSRKAQEKNLISVTKLDRKSILTRLGINEKAALAMVSHRRISSPVPQEIDPIIKKSSSEKPHVRTYSRKQSLHELRPSSRRQSLANEDQNSDTDFITSNNEIADELAAVKTENLNLERSLRNISSFLQNYLGVTADQLKAMEECDCNTVELNNIASNIKNRIAHANVMSRSDPLDSKNLSASSFCYQAVKHPVRGWEMTKQDLSSVLFNCDDYGNSLEFEKDNSTSIEECLAKGSTLLKRAFSILISQMREHNKFKSHEEFETFCQKVIMDCLADAVDSVRDLLNGLLSSRKIDDEQGEIERWVDISRNELCKLFHSLTMTLQSLRDIPSNQQKQPTSLFHLPLPTFSLALNPAKVTHSVVLEMYVRFGLAELQRIVMSILGSGPDTVNSSCSTSYSNGKTNNNYQEVGQNPSSSQEKISNCTPFCEDLLQSPDFSQLAMNQETIKEEFVKTGEGRRSSQMKCTRQSQSSKSEGNYHQYTLFKASLGNVLVSSFKKQIQEKIQSSSSPSH